MKILVACEFSGLVRDAFIAKGHEAISCDLLPTERPGPHIKGDVLPLLSKSWDMIIAFPSCTDLAASGAKHWADKWLKDPDRMYRAERFFLAFVGSAPKVCIENPVGRMSSIYKPPTQYIQPWQHGHGVTKKTGLWLEGLPLLMPSNVVEGRSDAIHKMPGGKNQAKNRSRTFEGIALAMAEQWG